MRYFLIDRIERLEVDKEIRAVKNVALSEDYFSDHFPGAPVMPGALLIESLAQAGTALLEVSRSLKKKALLIMVDRAKFRALVRPGDRLVITAEVRSISDESAQVEGRIEVGGRVAVTALLTFSLADVDRYYPARWRPHVLSLYQVWLEEAEMIGVGVPEEQGP